MWFLLCALAGPAHATPECENLCTSLDDAEELCEAAYGDGGFCERIGTLEESCDPEDGGTTETCPQLCPRTGALDEACGAALGATDPVCEALHVLARDCEDGTYDGPGGRGGAEDDDDDDEEVGRDASPSGATASVNTAGCATVAAGGWLGWLALATGLTRRRRSGPRSGCP